jgi:hypothetical protein
LQEEPAENILKLEWLSLAKISCTSTNPIRGCLQEETAENILRLEGLSLAKISCTSTNPIGGCLQQETAEIHDVTGKILVSSIYS